MIPDRYPKWRKDRCVHCAAGVPMALRDDYHWTGNPDPPKCTAPENPDELIAQLEFELEEAINRMRRNED